MPKNLAAPSSSPVERSLLDVKVTVRTLAILEHTVRRCRFAKLPLIVSYPTGKYASTTENIQPEDLKDIEEALANMLKAITNNM